jgi:hypothetical protein
VVFEHRDGCGEQQVSGQKLISADERDGGRSRQQWRGKVERERISLREEREEVV